MYKIRKQASKIVINGRSIIVNPDDVPVELRLSPLKQLGKIQKILSALNANEELTETDTERKLEIITQKHLASRLTIMMKLLKFADIILQ